MKKSKYNYIIKTDNNNYLATNFLSNGILLLNEEQYRQYCEHEDKVDNELYSILVKNGFIIDDDIDEKKIMHQYRAQGIYGDSVSTFRILTTKNCNANCFYCYENRAHDSNMTIKTANQVCEFIRHRAINNKKIQIQWFGGEPLLNTEVIDYISNNLFDELIKCGKTLNVSMVTNGLLITQEIIEKMKLKWNISKLQISLDGTEPYYSCRKGIKGDNLSFVIDNIVKISKMGITVSIRLNYDQNNLESIFKLVGILSEQLKGLKNISVYPFPLYGSYDEENSGERFKTSYKDLFALLKALEQSNLTASNLENQLHYRRGQCFACAVNSFVIDSDGQIYKCTADLENPVGNVWDGIILNNTFYSWCDADVADECEECSYLPLCQGGCKAGHMKLGTNKCFILKNVIDDLLLDKYKKYLSRKLIR